MFSDVPSPRYQDREPTPPRGSDVWISVDFGGFWGKGTGWELGRSARYLDCYEMLINVYHDLS